MSICDDCSFIYVGEGFRQCSKDVSPINGDCIHFLERLPSPLTNQVGGAHYKNLAIQPIEYCQKNKLNYCESNVIKYVTRHKFKKGVEDINKAIHNLELLKEMEY